MSETFHGTEAETAVEHDAETLKIRTLNDQLRQTLSGGRIMMTPGVQALPENILPQALEAIQRFEDFTVDNDPYGQHDFGEVVIEETRVWFKIDAYDLNFEYGSPDPADPCVTARVMTILLPSEY